MIIEEGFGLLASVVVLAGIAYAIANGGKTASIISAGGDSFASIINAATGRA